MALSVHTRNPQFKVRIVSQRSGEIRFEDIRPSFVEFNVRRQIGQTAGTFQMSLLPKRPPRGLGESWTDVIGPMDYVELWAWVPPRTPERPLMRGFVDQVGETFSIGSGQPQRSIVVAGRDYGVVALIAKPLDLHDPAVVEVSIFNRWARGIRRITGHGETSLVPEVLRERGRQDAFFAPATLMRVIFEEFYDAQQQEVLGTFPRGTIPTCTFKAETDDWEQRLQAKNPSFNLSNRQPYIDVWSLFRAYQHAPWRELFFEDTETGPRLLYRPTPWYDLAGNRVQDFTDSVEIVPCSREQIMEYQRFRSNAEVMNYFFTVPDNMESVTAVADVMGGSFEGVMVDAFRGNPFLVGYESRDEADAFRTDLGSRFSESAYQRFGVRPIRVSTPYLDFDAVGDAIDIREGSEVRRQIASVLEQGREGNMRLARALGHMDRLQSGALSLKGDERLRVGCYLHFVETGELAYAAALGHRFRQGTSPADGVYTTSVEFTRGRGALPQPGATNTASGRSETGA